MQKGRETLAETHDVVVIFDGQHFTITPEIGPPILKSIFCQRSGGGFEVVSNQQRFAALNTEIVQSLCLMS
jgi:hypothetical protein